MKNIGTATIRFVIGCAVTALFWFLLAQNPLPLEIVEAKLYDFRLQARGKIPAPDTVVIAAIDEKSLAQLGRWPWSRRVIARLVDKLAASDAAVIAFDVIFPEADQADPILSRAIDRAGNVVLPVAFDLEGAAPPVPDPTLEESALVRIEEPDLYQSYPPIMSVGAPIRPVAPLEKSAMSLAHISMLPDYFDGTLRWEALLIGYRQMLYPSLGLRCAACFKGIAPENLVVRATRSISLGKTTIPTDHWGRMPINYYGPGRTLRHISVADILSGKVGTKELGNRIVIVGPTAIGIEDLRVTPFSAVMPGVEKQATVAASILDRRFLVKATPLQDLGFLLVAGLALALALSRLRLVWGASAALAYFVGTGVAGSLLFNHLGLWINLTCPLANGIFMFTSVTAWNYAFEERRARKIRAMFSSYVTTAIVNELIRNPELAHLGGEKREITVLFSDVRAFASFSEQHQPEEVVALLNEYLGAMTEVVLKWGGTLDKFIGDAIMVFWNAPLCCQDHAERSLLCAIEMQARLAQLHLKWHREGKQPLSCGIGINTGEVIVGNIGAEGKKMDYTVIGNEVDLASRVESLTRYFDVDILITERTVAKLRSAVEAGTLTGFRLKGVRRVIVKGKQQPIVLYQVLPCDGGPPITECPDPEPLRLTEK